VHYFDLKNCHLIAICYTGFLVHLEFIQSVMLVSILKNKAGKINSRAHSFSQHFIQSLGEDNTDYARTVDANF